MRGFSGGDMPAGWKKTRKTFRHGHLAQALVDAVVARLKTEGVETLSLRELARDAGVNHRAVYRHFPDKLSLLARVAEEGWRRLGRRVERRTAGKTSGEPRLVAAGVGFFLFARDYPNLFALMAGPRINAKGAFPDLETAISDTLDLFCRPFLDSRLELELARTRTAIFISALQGVTAQMLHGRLRVSQADANDFVGDISRRLFNGLR
jgi:AcrR family transcriptional regulator